MSKAMIFQSYSWEENKIQPGRHTEELWCWSKFAYIDGLKNIEARDSCLIRITDFPYELDIEIDDTYTSHFSVSENNVMTEEILNLIEDNFREWIYKDYRARCKLYNHENNLIMEEKRNKRKLCSELLGHVNPIAIERFSNYRTIYHFKPQKFELGPDGRYPEKRCLIMKLKFNNREYATQFIKHHLKISYGMTSFKNFVMDHMSFKIRILNSGISSVCRLLTELNAKRCSWFKIDNAETPKLAERICKDGFPEFMVSVKNLTIFMGEAVSVPKIVSFDIECYSDNHKALPNPWALKHKLFAVSLIYQIGADKHTRKRKAFVIPRCNTHIGDEDEDKVIEVCNSEHGIFTEMVNWINEMDPDILIGYNIFGFDIPYMSTRLRRVNLPWGNLSRLRNYQSTTQQVNWASSAYGKNVLAWIDSPGRIFVDMMVIIQRDYKFTDYKLETVSQALLGVGKNDVSAVEMFEVYEKCLRGDPGCEDEMLRVIRYCIQDSVLPIELFTRINGWAYLTESSNVMNVNPMELFTRGQQLRLMNQYFEKCTKLGFAIDRRIANKIEAEGAYVVEPIRGIHSNVLVFDYQSLYPTIIIAFNISHDTLVLDDSIPDEHCHVFEWSDGNNENIERVENPEHHDVEEPPLEMECENDNIKRHMITKTEKGKWRFRFIKPEYGHKGIAPVMLEDLLAERKRVRKQQSMTKDPVLWSILEERQKAVKVSCNSVYGMLLAQESGKLSLAEGGVCTTFKGRELNLFMQQIIRDEFHGITSYGDTDSVMVVIDLIRKFIQYIQNKNVIEEDLDVFRNNLLHDFKSTPVVAEILSRISAPCLQMARYIHIIRSENPNIGLSELHDAIYTRFQYICDRDILKHRFEMENYGLTSEILMCTVVGNMISETISRRLPPPIKLEFENIFHTALFMMKKRYACIKIDMKTQKPIMNPDKIYSKGIMLARRDNCKWARDTFKRTLWNVLLRKDYRELVTDVMDLILRPLRWQEPIENYLVVQKLGYDYSSETYPLKLFGDHLEEIGKPARPNDRVAYVVTRLEEDALGKRFRLVETLRDEMTRGINSIDHMYYIERLQNDMDQIISIGYMSEIAEFETRRHEIERCMLDKAEEDNLYRLKKLQDEMGVCLSNEKGEKSKISNRVRQIKKEITILEKNIETKRKSYSQLLAKNKRRLNQDVSLHLGKTVFADQVKILKHFSRMVMKELIEKFSDNTWRKNKGNSPNKENSRESKPDKRETPKGSQNTLFRYFITTKE